MKSMICIFIICKLQFNPLVMNKFDLGPLKHKGQNFTLYFCPIKYNLLVVLLNLI